MQKFRLQQNAFKELRKKMLMRSVPLMLLATTAGLFISTINAKDKAADVTVFPIVIPMIVIVVVFSIWRSVKTQKALLESYTLTISDVSVKREQLNTQTVAIYLGDIKTIEKHKNGSFLIKGSENVDLIGIPPQIENYEQLELTLESLRSINVKENVSVLERYQFLFGLVTLASMVCVYTVNNKIIVAIAGTFSAGTLIWSFIKVRQSKNVDNKTKKAIWWSLLVLASIVAITIFKVTGWVEMKK